MSKRRNYEDLGEIALPEEVAAKVDAAVDRAERDLAEARVNFRWGSAQVDVVKRAADLAGVPYQTYIKQVVWRQAIEDIRSAAAVGIDGGPHVARATCDHDDEEFAVPGADEIAVRLMH
jgi:predicted DNA binding CopG/RHH family protein